MGWADDLLGVAKGVVSGGGNALENVGKALVNEEAWKQILTDPGDASFGDWANAALDASMLIPGAGLVGGAARMGTRAGARALARQGGEEAAERAATRALYRSPLNNALRGKADDAAGGVRGLLAGERGAHAGTRAKDPLTAALTRSGGGKHVGPRGPGSGAAGTRASTGAASKGAARNPNVKTTPWEPGQIPRNQIQRIAGKQQAGIGLKRGFGQTKRRVGRNAAIYGGANALAEAYDQGVFGGLFGGEGGGDSGGNEEAALPEGMFEFGGSGGPGFYLVGANGSSTPLPDSYLQAIAEYLSQNGTIEGAQVIYNK